VLLDHEQKAGASSSKKGTSDDLKEKIKLLTENLHNLENVSGRQIRARFPFCGRKRKTSQQIRRNKKFTIAEIARKF